jgi:hypothetical protein
MTKRIRAKPAGQKRLKRRFYTILYHNFVFSTYIAMEQCYYKLAGPEIRRRRRQKGAINSIPWGAGMVSTCAVTTHIELRNGTCSMLVRSSIVSKCERHYNIYTIGPVARTSQYEELDADPTYRVTVIARTTLALQHNAKIQVC